MTEVTRPQARATLRVEPAPPATGPHVISSLVEHMHRVLLRIESNEDALAGPILYIRSDPPCKSARPEEAFFFHVPEEGVSSACPEVETTRPNQRMDRWTLSLSCGVCPDSCHLPPRTPPFLPHVCPVLPSQGSHVPLPLGKELQPLGLMVLAKEQDVLAAHSQLTLPLWFRPIKEGRVKVNIVLVYHSAKPSTSGPGMLAVGQFSNLMISSDLIFEVESHVAFTTTFEVASPPPTLLPVRPLSLAGQGVALTTARKRGYVVAHP